MRAGRLVAVGLTALLMSVAAGAQEFRLVRPMPEAGPTEVTLALAIVDILTVDDVNENFVADFVLRATWHDPRLAWEAEEDKEAAVFGLDEVWHPPLMIVNEQDLDRLNRDEIEVQADGSARYQQRFRGTLSSELHLKEFPFDTQRLSIRVIVIRHSPEEVELAIDEDWTLLLDTAAVSGWRLKMASPVLEVTELPTANARFAGGSFVIVAEREVGYFLWTMAVPLALILFMAWMVFWIDPNFLPSQVGVATASVFSLIAYRTALRLSLPKVSYMTRADIFVLGATALVFGALGAAIATGRLAKRGQEEAAQAIDRWARWLYVILLVGLLFLSRYW